MKKKTFIIFVSVFLTAGFCQQCKKTVEEWAFCEGCGLESWAGKYNGTGSYYKDETNEIVDGVEVQLEIENPSANQFLIKVLAPDYYSQSFFSTKSDSLYYFSIANQTNSINMNLYKKGSEFKITGVAKKGHLEWVDSVYVIVPDHSLTFELYKKQ
ncbi:MAG: hypothetical protein L3J66_00330 [Bacteroidales bacterium]|nr:hypothetical protein [Bacteroidales bacterium]